MINVKKIALIGVLAVCPLMIVGSPRLSPFKKGSTIPTKIFYIQKRQFHNELKKLPRLYKLEKKASQKLIKTEYKFDKIKRNLSNYRFKQFFQKKYINYLDWKADRKGRVTDKACMRLDDQRRLTEQSGAAFLATINQLVTQSGGTGELSTLDFKVICNAFLPLNKIYYLRNSNGCGNKHYIDGTLKVAKENLLKNGRLSWVTHNLYDGIEGCIQTGKPFKKTGDF